MDRRYIQRMAKLGFIERAIARRENLADGYTIKFFHSLGGRDVRTDKEVAGVYDYLRKLGDEKNVKDLLGRVTKKVPGLIAKVYGPDGKPVHGNTKLGSIRK